MASLIFPERFTKGNYGALLKNFERCAAANACGALTHVRMLPAFLQGPVSTYYESLTEEQMATYDGEHLVYSLEACFCSYDNRERYYREFEDATLSPFEDSTRLLWHIKESLRTIIMLIL